MLTRGTVSHAYSPAPMSYIAMPGVVRITTRTVAQTVQSIPQTWAITRPVTAPNGNGAPFYVQPDKNYILARGGSVALSPAKPSLAMDPTDPATWQREYRF